MLSAAVLLWIGYRAVVEREQAATLVATRSAGEGAALLIAALTRDMRGAQQLVLSSADRDGLTARPPVDLLHPIASAFARYPYLDAFFSWRDVPAEESPVFYTRAERAPGWLSAQDHLQMFPVVVSSNGTLASRLLPRLQQDLAEGRRFSIFDRGWAARAIRSSPCCRTRTRSANGRRRCSGSW